jgi:transcription factor IIIB 90 kDa subunit
VLFYFLFFIIGNSRKKKLMHPQRRKTSNKPRDSADPTGNTAAESVRTLLKKNPKYSKRINYDALKGLFESSIATNEDKDDYTLDTDKSDAEMMLVDEDARDTPASRAQISRKESPARGEMDLEEVEEEELGSDKGENYGGWEDTFEQEAF